MKKIIAWILLYLFPLMLWIPEVQAADTSNLSVTALDKGDYVIFTGILIHTGAATDDVRSQAIDLTGLLLDGAVIQVKSLVGGTRDVNIDIEGSNFIADSTFEQYQTRLEFDDFSADDAGDEKTAFLDRDFFKVDSLAKASLSTDLAAISATGEARNVNINDSLAGNSSVKAYITWTEKDLALRCRYIRVVSDGQTGNLATVSTQFILKLKKDPNYKPTSASQTRSRVKNTTS